MTARDQIDILQGVAMCAEPTCDATTDVIHTKRGAVIENVLIRRGGEEIRLCLLCFFACRQRYESDGFQFVELEKVKQLGCTTWNTKLAKISGTQGFTPVRSARLKWNLGRK